MFKQLQFVELIFEILYLRCSSSPSSSIFCYSVLVLILLRCKGIFVELIFIKPNQGYFSKSLIIRVKKLLVALKCPISVIHPYAPIFMF